MRGLTPDTITHAVLKKIATSAAKLPRADKTSVRVGADHETIDQERTRIGGGRQLVST
jgi:hypothetical protein